jgi:hypothetical protein
MLYVLLILSLGCCVIAAAQQQGDAPPVVRESASTNRHVLPPLPSLSTVDTFRKILALPAAEREKYLATRTPEQRQIIEWKLREYQAMDAAERDRRLRELQVNVYIRQLIKMPASNRTDYLKMLRPIELEMTQERLRQWDALPAKTQRQVIQYEWIIRSTARSYPPMVPAGMRVDQRETDLARWRNLPIDEKEKVLANFQRFCEKLDEREKSKALNSLSETEQRQMLASLQAFERLPKDKRDRCLDGFKKFADLPREERAKFLVNVNQWQSMTQQERESWRVLVSKMSLLSAPPLPPEPGQGNPPLPPATSRPRTAVASTNGEDTSGK